MSLNELGDYRELNHTGFSKILKKFEKVVGQKLKVAYMTEIEKRAPFSLATMETLRMEVDKVITTYARIATDNNLAMAATELKSNLREHVCVLRFFLPLIAKSLLIKSYNNLDCLGEKYSLAGSS